MANLKKILRISRPRFWMYVLGTYMVGLIAAGDLFAHDLSVTLVLIALGLFFSLPANLFIYGVNDIFDYDTDRFNQKKTGYEQLVHPAQRPSLVRWIVGLLLPFLAIFLFISPLTSLALGVFCFAGYFYSGGPIRAKTLPPLDILFSSVIYVSPALVGYFAAGQTRVDGTLILGALSWAAAMQTYSAVPDIDADRKAGLQTLATVLGDKGALVFCLSAYLLAASIGYLYVGYLAALLGLIYAAIVLLSLLKPAKVFTYYTYFPLINIISGALLFFYLFFGTVSL